MDAIELIKKDHDRVEELFARFRGGGGLTGIVRRVTGNVTARERRTAVARICDELDLHARLEEEIFYPAVRATGDRELERLISESLREHTRVKEQVAALRASPEGEDLDTRVSELESCVQHHVSEEEGDMLPRAEELISAPKRNELGRRMQARKRAAPRQRERGRAAAPRSERKQAGTAGRRRVTKKASHARKASRARGKAKKRRTRSAVARRRG